MGCRVRPMTFVGRSRSRSDAPIEYVRIGPTPWVSTSQPSLVSIGEPQLPTCTASHAVVGISIGVAVGQHRMSSEYATAFVSPSWHDEHDEPPWILRGNSARPEDDAHDPGATLHGVTEGLAS